MKTYFITFETEKTEITIDITGMTSWGDDQLVIEACEQLGEILVDIQDTDKKWTQGVTGTPIDCRPLRVAYRQWMTLKRPPRKYSINWF
ncbi:MAG: hypothetical protein ACKPJC_25370 [Microcystis panniformis]